MLIYFIKINICRSCPLYTFNHNIMLWLYKFPVEVIFILIPANMWDHLKSLLILMVSNEYFPHTPPLSTLIPAQCYDSLKVCKICYGSPLLILEAKWNELLWITIIDVFWKYWEIFLPSAHSPTSTLAISLPLFAPFILILLPEVILFLSLLPIILLFLSLGSSPLPRKKTEERGSTI